MVQPQDEFRVEARGAFRVVVVFAIRAARDLAIAAIAWVVLYLFHRLKTLLPVDGWPARALDGIHEWSTVVAAGLLIILVMRDLIHVLRSR